MERQERYHRNRNTVMGNHVLHAGDPGGEVIQA